MDTTPVIQRMPRTEPFLPLTRAQYEESIVRRLPMLPLDRLAQLANFARFLEFELGHLQSLDVDSPSKTYAARAGSADELLTAFADHEVLIYTPVAPDGAARILAESLGRDDYGNPQ